MSIRRSVQRISESTEHVAPSHAVVDTDAGCRRGPPAVSPLARRKREFATVGESALLLGRGRRWGGDGARGRGLLLPSFPSSSVHIHCTIC